MSRLVETGAECTSCKKGKIVVETVWSCDVPSSEVIYGPGGANQFSWKAGNIYCKTCLVVFREVPGKPNFVQEMLRDLANQSYRARAHPLGDW